MRVSVFAVAALLVVSQATILDMQFPTETLKADGTYLPTVIFHGLGDACANAGMSQITKYFGQKMGVYTVCPAYGESTASVATNFETQAQTACEMVQKDSNLQGDFNVVGLSHGGLIARYIVEKCELKGKVSKMVTFGGPHQGVAKMPKCFNGVGCDILNWAAGALVYTSYIQDHVGPAGYFKDPLRYSTYLADNVFLPAANNEKTSKDETAKANMIALDKICLIKFTKDTVVDPGESEWFGFYETGTLKTIQTMEETDTYKNDWLGLQTLDKAGKILKWSIDGDHLQFTLSDVDKVITEVLAN